MNIACWIASLLVGFIVCLSAAAQEEKSAADQIMEKYAGGEFERPRASILVSGWQMKTTGGKSFARSQLQGYAKNVIKLGPSACKDLLKYIEHDDMVVRYIAVYSIEETLNIDLPFPWFSTLEQVKENQWKQKYAEQVARKTAT